ncbi:hypothetical protein [Gudongella sp. DL1XJH-153]|uniref:hypothetical protein n=1 Tax=Gudongella sp. DL1XJH-153 TaxID=3409804 RepID=UPI003BB702D9
MAVSEKKFEHLKNDKRFSSELKKIKNIYKEIPDDKKKLVQRLVENASFMAILLEDLQEDIKQNGYKEEYKNGANQFGFKRSIAADLYQVTIKNYSSVIKQLNDLLPNNEIEEDDGFEAFVNSKNR